MPSVRKTKKRREQAERLKDLVEKVPDTGSLLSWGRGILEEADPGLGPRVTDSVFVVTERQLFYQFLEETPNQLLSPRALATGSRPSEWKQLARDSTATILFEELGEVDARQAVDGRWDVALVPTDGQSEFDVKGFGLIESYGGRGLEDVAAFIRSLPNGAGQAEEQRRKANAAMFDGSRPDATPAEVEAAAAAGQIHPRMPWDLVVEQVFGPRLEPGEHRVAFVFAVTTGKVGRGGTLGEWRPGWVLVTNQAAHWCTTTEGLPGAAAPMFVPNPGLPRRLPYERVSHYERADTPAGDGYEAVLVLFHDRPDGTGCVTAFSMGAGDRTAEVLNELAQRVVRARS